MTPENSHKDRNDSSSSSNGGDPALITDLVKNLPSRLSSDSSSSSRYSTDSSYQVSVIELGYLWRQVLLEVSAETESCGIFQGVRKNKLDWSIHSCPQPFQENLGI